MLSWNNKVVTLCIFLVYTFSLRAMESETKHSSTHYFNFLSPEQIKHIIAVIPPAARSSETSLQTFKNLLLILERNSLYCSKENYLIDFLKTYVTQHLKMFTLLDIRDLGTIKTEQSKYTLNLEYPNKTCKTVMDAFLLKIKHMAMYALCIIIKSGKNYQTLPCWMIL